MLGLRLYFSVICMFVGSAVISLYRRLSNYQYQPDISSVDEWLPFENQQQGPQNAETKMTPGSRLFAFKEPKDGSIKSIALLGERNSGTRWIYG